jgi:hypothetical protein
VLVQIPSPGPRIHPVFSDQSLPGIGLTVQSANAAQFGNTQSGAFLLLFSPLQRRRKSARASLEQKPSGRQARRTEGRKEGRTEKEEEAAVAVGGYCCCCCRSWFCFQHRLLLLPPPHSCRRRSRASRRGRVAPDVIVTGGKCGKQGPIHKYRTKSG